MSTDDTSTGVDPIDYGNVETLEHNRTWRKILNNNLQHHDTRVCLLKHMTKQRVVETDLASAIR